MEQAWWKSSFPAGDGNLSFSPLQAVVSASLELPPAFSCGSATCWLPLSLARFCVLEEKKNSPETLKTTVQLQLQHSLTTFSL